MGAIMLQSLNQWRIKQRCKYRLFKLKELRTENENDVLGNLEYALTVFDEYIFTQPDKWDMVGTEIESRIPNITTLLLLTKAAKESFADTNEINYNKRLISETVGFSTIMDWYWRPMQQKGLNCSTLLKAFSNEFKYFIEFSKKEENKLFITYINRGLKPLINNYYSLVDIIDYLYFNNQ